MNAISGKSDWGRLFENVVFLELKRRKRQNQEIAYWKSRSGTEVDFIVREGLKTTEIIQVVYDLDDEKTWEREVRGLVACAKEFSIKTTLLITREAEGEKRADGITIRCKPLWKWLLGL